MIETSARQKLPLMAAGQSQKEIVHNEALLLADLLLAPVAESLGLNAPPAAPALGACWIVGAAPTGDWAGQAGALAGWTTAGWRFAAPFEGLHVWLRGAGLWAVRGASGWTSGTVAAGALAIGGQQVVGTRRPAIADPSGGATVDAEARAGLASVLAAMRQHGLIAT